MNTITVSTTGPTGRSTIAEPTLVADFSDQTGIFDPHGIAETLTVIGIGGIGASILPTLVSMGWQRYRLIDPDVVEPRNVASQLLFAPCDLNRPKVEIAAEYLVKYGATHVDTEQRLFTADDQVDGVVICGVDTMAARQMIWQVVRNSMASLYLDGRIGGTAYNLFAVEPFDGDWYERFLFGEDRVMPLPCTQRAYIAPAVELGAKMADLLAKWSRGEGLPKHIDADLGSYFYQVIGKPR